MDGIDTSLPTYDGSTSAADIFSGLGNVASTVANGIISLKQIDANLAQQQASIDLQKTYAQAQQTIGQAQAQAAVSRAQQQAYLASQGYYTGLDQTLANFGARLTSGGSDSMMLWLAAAGLVVAVLQFKKRKG